MRTSSGAELWETIALEAGHESPLWRASLRPVEQQERQPVFSLLAEPRFALGIETIYEGYLLHYGRPRLFAAQDPDTELLLGDYLYAHGLVRVAGFEDVDAVADLAELISLCAHLRADSAGEDGPAWAGTAAALGTGSLSDPRAALRDDHDSAPLIRLARELAGPAAVEQALAAHARRLR